MREFAIVKELKKNSDDSEQIYVLPMLTMACLKCRTGCLRQGKPFLVKNSANFKLRKGCAVRIGLPRISRAIHGILSFIVPISCAIAGWFVAPYAFSKLPLFLQTLDAEFLRAIFVLAFLAFSAGIAFVVSRSSIHFSTPEIISLM